MKKIALLAVLIISTISSCKKSGWSQEDQDRFMKDCTAMDNSEDGKDRCKCGLNVMMENYSSLEEAQKAVQKMSKEEVENLFIDCAF